ncbi:MAG: glycosyltransferase [Candidatus Pacebacteria bacterium]|nr:glycosyltransferase [Candidatus Paceibacterota bacterium]
MTTFSLTCLIPFYNENSRCVSVLEQLTKIAEIDHFICVDDGSTDNTVELIKAAFPHVRILSLAKNSGKAAAVRLGLEQIVTTHTLLFDADMHQFSVVEIRAGIRTIQIDQKIDLLIFQQKSDPLLSKLLSTDVLFSGERIGKTNLLKAACQQPTIGYLLELTMNQFFFSKKLQVHIAPLHAKNYLKLQKWPVATALKKSWQLFALLRSEQFWEQRRLLRQLL